MNGQFPPGWYTNQYGQSQWWDGQQWGPLAQTPPPQQVQFNAPTMPPPGANMQYAGAAAKRESGSGALWGCLIVFIVLAAIIGSCTAINAGINSAGSDGAQETRHTQPPAQPDYTSMQDDHMEELGYETWESGNIYVRFLSDEEKSSLSCSYARCSWVAVVALDGCSGGIYVQVDLMSNGTPVDWTNAISASARPEEEVIVELNTFNENVDRFRLSEISCLT